MMALDSSCQISHKLMDIWVGYYDCASTAKYDAKQWTLNIIIIIMRNTPIIGADIVQYVID